ncbi:MAG: hypothetical protein WCS52_01960 [bacterium]
MNQSDMDILNKEAEEATALARKEENPDAPAPVIPPVPDPVPNAELTELKNQLDAEKARVAELTAKLNEADGRRGGELRMLRESVESMRVQMQTLSEENRKLSEAAKNPPPPAAPSVDDEEDKAFAEHFPTRAAREKAEAKRREAELEKIRQEALEAKKKAELLERQSMQTATQRFAEEVKAKVPTFLEVIRDPAFNAWANATRIKGTPMTFGDSYDQAAANLDVNQAIEVLEAYASSKQPITPPAAPVVDTTKPPKPSKEAQSVPASAAGGGAETVPDPSKDKSKRAARIKELEYKVFESRTATVAERAEIEKLWREAEADNPTGG